MKTDIQHNSVLVSGSGGLLEIISPQGEVVAEVAVPPGRHRAGTFIDFLEPGYVAQAAEGVAVFPPRSGYGRIAYGPGSHDTAANPHFKPTSADHMARQLRQLTDRLAATERRLKAREKAQAAIPRIPEAPVQQKPQGDTPVVE